MLQFGLANSCSDEVTFVTSLLMVSTCLSVRDRCLIRHFSVIAPLGIGHGIYAESTPARHLSRARDVMIIVDQV